MSRALLLLALGMALLQLAIALSLIALSSLVGEVRGEGVVRDYRLHTAGTAIVASAAVGGCLAAAALLFGRRRRWLATGGVIAGALPGLYYLWPPLVLPALLLVPLGPLAIWVPGGRAPAARPSP